MTIISGERAEELLELERLVRMVRDMQRKYFKTRDRSLLVECKKLERLLDDALGI